MNSEMFKNLVWPTISKAITDKGFKPSLISNEAIRDGAYILLSPENVSNMRQEKQFHDTVIDSLIQLHIPFEDESDGLYTLIFINFDKLRAQDINKWLIK